MSMHPTRNLFAEFKGYNRVFVETGTYRGDGIQLALDAGFERIISIDRDQDCIDFCMDRFALHNNPQQNILLYHGDSAKVLERIINDVHEPITFWLDSHWQMLEGTDPGTNPFPLMIELRQILNHRRNDHTILIDDWLYMTHPKITKVSAEQVTYLLRQINPAYKLDLFANPVIDNLLVAHL